MAEQQPYPSGLWCVDVRGILVQPEPMGNGWQAMEEGRPTNWSRGDTADEAVGSLIRRLAFEHKGVNARRARGEW